MGIHVILLCPSWKIHFSRKDTMSDQVTILVVGGNFFVEVLFNFIQFQNDIHWHWNFICPVITSDSAGRILLGMGKFELDRLTINSQLCEQNLRKVVKVKRLRSSFLIIYFLIIVPNRVIKLSRLLQLVIWASWS